MQDGCSRVTRSRLTGFPGETGIAPVCKSPRSSQSVWWRSPRSQSGLLLKVPACPGRSRGCRGLRVRCPAEGSAGQRWASVGEVSEGDGWVFHWQLQRKDSGLFFIFPRWCHLECGFPYLPSPPSISSVLQNCVKWKLKPWLLALLLTCKGRSTASAEGFVYVRKVSEITSLLIFKQIQLNASKASRQMLLTYFVLLFFLMCKKLVLF